MSMLSEQVKELRNYERFFKGDRLDGNLSPIFGNAANTIEALSAKVAAANMDWSVTHDCKMKGWQFISEYSREKYDWVLIKYFEKGSEFECVPVVAEMHRDGTWHTIDDVEISENYEVRYFFDMQQLDFEAHDNGGWIPCEDRLPEEKTNPITKDFYEYQVTFQSEDVSDVRHYKFGNGHWWNFGANMDEYVTAWRPNLEPYQPQRS